MQFKLNSPLGLSWPAPGCNPSGVVERAGLRQGEVGEAPEGAGTELLTDLRCSCTFSPRPLPSGSTQSACQPGVPEKPRWSPSQEASLSLALLLGLRSTSPYPALGSVPRTVPWASWEQGPSSPPLLLRVEMHAVEWANAFLPQEWRSSCLTFLMSR